MFGLGLGIIVFGCNSVLGIPEGKLREPMDACVGPGACGQGGRDASLEGGPGVAGDAGPDGEAGVAGYMSAGVGGHGGDAADGGSGGNDDGMAGEGGAGAGGSPDGEGGGAGIEPQGFCEPDERDCDGRTPLTCVNGAWTLAAATCDFGCAQGECYGECTADARECRGQEHRVCTAELRWQQTVCPSVCDVEEGCIGQCQQGQQQCDGLVLQQCSDRGEYEPIMTCTHACLVVADAAQCVGCTPNDGVCPPGCMSPADNDCLREPGEVCSTGSQCRQGQCVDGVCCNSGCTEGCHSCNQAGSAGTCRVQSFDEDANNCGSCGARCSTAHIDAACSGGMCDGSCERGYGDCNNNKRTDGCEVDLRTQPEHCGTCGHVCQYGVCSGSSCVFDRWGLYDAGPQSERRSGNAMMGMKLTIARAGRLVALGMQTVIGAGDISAQIRFGLYSDSSGVPQSLIAQTGVLQTVNGPTEGAITPTSIAQGEYWFFFLANDATRIATETVNAQWATREVQFGPLPSSAPGLALPTLARANIYAVTVP